MYMMYAPQRVKKVESSRHKPGDDLDSRVESISDVVARTVGDRSKSVGDSSKSDEDSSKSVGDRSKYVRESSKSESVYTKFK